ncbi:P-loop NTPase fold protein [Salegentibacter sp. Hel_I_6]|uniref:KAP family P-loop NTPase fold protein n=1 Tax=Salegentibacter sp. Hel_I_6 TaxID=1250278 RepID=UPI00056C951B|nr:P-loop NTPase fold protein [Salegentibacter sp. Hel_I_6]
MENKNLITNETAIKYIEDDSLNFLPFAEKIQNIIRGYSNNPEPLTIGIYGKWGTGKSSLLNLIENNIEIFHKEEEDKPYIKFHYNPWLYQTKEEMLFDFFDTLSRKLNYSDNENLIKAGKLIKKYSRYLKAVKLSASVGIPKLFNAGVTIEPYEILKKLGEDLEGEEKSLNELKEEIDQTLSSSDKKIIVFIDDVDRLDKDEIFTLFKLIKINADFKNLVFLICLDPDYVAKAIHNRYGNDVHSGQEFLEKIINIPLELPLIEEADLDFFVKEKIKGVLSTSPNVKTTDLKELLESLRGSYFSSPREIIRIINSFAISVYAIGNEVNIHDLFWIEYIKIKYFKTYEAIKRYASDFKSSNLFIENINFNDVYSQNNVETGLRKELLESHSEAYKIIDFLFPMVRTGTVSAYQSSILKPNRTLDAELRINHSNHFEKYFSFHTQGKISEFSFSNFLANISPGKYDKALEDLNEMIEASGERKIVYRIATEIEVIKGKLQNRFILFLIQNIDRFSEVSDLHPHSIEIIQVIAKKLVLEPKDNKDLILSITESLDYFQLSWYLGIFSKRGEKFEFLDKIEEKLVAKVKDSHSHPFFEKRDVAKMIMQVWAKRDFNEFGNYILKYIDSKENSFAFIRVFPHLWNRDIQGVFKQEDFIYLTEVLNLDSKLIFDKIKEVVPEIRNISKIEDINVTWEENNGNSAMENIQQFFYWHLSKEKQEVADNSLTAGPPPIGGPTRVPE